MYRICILLIAAIPLVCGHAEAGEYNRVLNIGDAAPAWTGLMGVDDAEHSLADLESHPVVVVVFTCNSCPYSVDAEDRVIKLKKAYRTGHFQLAAV